MFIDFIFVELVIVIFVVKGEFLKMFDESYKIVWEGSVFVVYRRNLSIEKDVKFM